MTFYHEAALIREGKYVKRIDLGFTDAEPTVVFDPQDINAFLPSTHWPALPRLCPDLLHLTLAAQCVNGENKSNDHTVSHNSTSFRFRKIEEREMAHL